MFNVANKIQQMYKISDKFKKNSQFFVRKISELIFFLNFSLKDKNTSI